MVLLAFLIRGQKYYSLIEQQLIAKTVNTVTSWLSACTCTVTVSNKHTVKWYEYGFKTGLKVNNNDVLLHSCNVIESQMFKTGFHINKSTVNVNASDRDSLSPVKKVFPISTNMQSDAQLSHEVPMTTCCSEPRYVFGVTSTNMWCMKTNCDICSHRNVSSTVHTCESDLQREIACIEALNFIFSQIGAMEDAKSDNIVKATTAVVEIDFENSSETSTEINMQTDQVCIELMSSLLDQVCECSSNDEVVRDNDMKCATTVLTENEKTCDVLFELLPFAQAALSSERIQNTELVDLDIKAAWCTDLPFIQCADLFDGEKNIRHCVKKKKKQKRKKKTFTKMFAPNYFIAVQISDLDIKKSISSIQNNIMKCEPRMERALINVKTLHITIAVLYADMTSLENAKAVLKKCHDIIIQKPYINDLILTFEGLDHFRDQVLFASMKDGESKTNLCEIADIVRAELADNGFEIEDRGFTPHLTIAKLSRAPYLRRVGIKKIDSKWYLTDMDRMMGTQRVNSLQLLSMRKKDASGYYFCEEEVFF